MVIGDWRSAARDLSLPGRTNSKLTFGETKHRNTKSAVEFQLVFQCFCDTEDPVFMRHCLC